MPQTRHLRADRGAACLAGLQIQVDALGNRKELPPGDRAEFQDWTATVLLGVADPNGAIRVRDLDAVATAVAATGLAPALVLFTAHDFSGTSLIIRPALWPAPGAGSVHETLSSTSLVRLEYSESAEACTFGVSSSSNRFLLPLAK